MSCSVCNIRTTVFQNIEINDKGEIERLCEDCYVMKYEPNLKSDWKRNDVKEQIAVMHADLDKMKDETSKLLEQVKEIRESSYYKRIMEVINK